MTDKRTIPELRRDIFLQLAKSFRRLLDASETDQERWASAYHVDARGWVQWVKEHIADAEQSAREAVADSQQETDGQRHDGQIHAGFAGAA